MEKGIFMRHNGSCYELNVYPFLKLLFFTYSRKAHRWYHIVMKIFQYFQGVYGRQNKAAVTLNPDNLKDEMLLCHYYNS